MKKKETRYLIKTLSSPTRMTVYTFFEDSHGIEFYQTRNVSDFSKNLEVDSPGKLELTSRGIQETKRSSFSRRKFALDQAVVDLNGKIERYEQEKLEIEEKISQAKVFIHLYQKESSKCVEEMEFVWNGNFVVDDRNELCIKKVFKASIGKEEFVKLVEIEDDSLCMKSDEFDFKKEDFSSKEYDKMKDVISHLMSIPEFSSSVTREHLSFLLGNVVQG